MGFKTRPIPDFTTHSGEFLSNNGSELEWLPGGGSIPGGLAVRAATTANIGNVTYNNGAAGVGATLTKNINQAFPNIDGVVMMLGDRVLLKNQTTQLQNGIYEITDAGSGATPWVLTRTTDSDTTAELDDQVVTPSSGTVNIDQNFGQTTVNPVVGTDPIVYSVGAGGFVRQQTSGTAALGQIPFWINSQRTLSKGNSDFKWLQASGILSVNFGGNGLFRIDDPAGEFHLGYWTGGGNGAALNIIDGTSIAFQADSGNRFLYDMGTKKYQLGDIDAQDFNSVLTINDPLGQLTYSLSGFNFLFAAGGFSGLGDLDSSGNGIFFALNDSLKTAGVNILASTATWEVFDKNYPTMGAPVFQSTTALTYNMLVGVFQTGETVTGGTSGATGVIVTDNSSVMTLSGVIGVFIVGETITGGISGATANTTIVDIGGPDDLTNNGIYNDVQGDTITVFIDGLSIDYNTLVGLFQNGETVTFSGGSTGQIYSDDGVSNMHVINMLPPAPVFGETITGGTSGATATITATKDTFNASGALAGNLVQSEVITTAPQLVSQGLMITFATNTGHDVFAPTTWTMTSGSVIPGLRHTNAFGTPDFTIFGDGSLVWTSPSGSNFMTAQPAENVPIGIQWKVGDIDINGQGTTINLSDSNSIVDIQAKVFRAGDGSGLYSGTVLVVNDITQLITMTNVPAYANDAAATGAGLTTGDLYKTTTLGITSLNIVP